jgi:C4-dicarboxylate-specific signal transduction histidine kinase
VWLLNHAKRIDWKGQAVVQVGLIDITERKWAEEELRVSEERSRFRLAELAHVHRLGMMGEMATELAHELNQPLGAITNYASGCIRRLRGSGTPGDEIFGAIGKILSQAERANEIIRRMRQFAGRHESILAAVDLNDAIRDSQVLIDVEAKKFDVEVALNLEENLPDVWADRLQIQQVILNLSRNGMEAMFESEASPLLLTIRTSVNDNGEAQVSVWDTGDGVPTNLNTRAFEPFFTTKQEGVGLGLSLCRTFIEDNGGRLWSQRGLGGGMAFHFTLPLAQKK